jgi:modification methylase
MTQVSPHRDLGSLPVNFWLIGQESPVTQRRGRYTPESTRSHPGKMAPALARRLIQAYTRPGAWILDPLSGIGTTGVEAVTLGRHYVGIELEERFVAWQRENLELARRHGAAGRFAVFQGDARNLTGATLGQDVARRKPLGVDAIITSPPYGDRLRPKTSQVSRVLDRLISREQWRRDILPGSYGDSADNLGNLPDAAYLREMTKVYTGCYQVLRPGGILAVVIRPGRDRQRLRPLHHETARLCVAAGFDFIDEIAAIYSRVVAVPHEPVEIYAHALFFKRLAIAHLREAGWPVTLEQFEYVLVFQKPALDRELLAFPKLQHKSGPAAALASPAPHLRS